MQRLDQYYANELQYLSDAGREFARNHPQQAALLNPDNIQSRDPHVERLFENFAFLTGSIRAKLDDELPELSQTLLSLLCPHYVRAVPALATVQLRPDYMQLTGVATIEADAELKCNPLVIAATGEQLVCSFRTSYAVDLYPLDLTAVRMCGPEGGCDGIELTFELCGSATWEEVELDRIRLHLHGETHQLVYSLYYHLMHRVSRVDIGSSDVDRRGSAHIEAVGFGRCEAVIPYDAHSFPGLRLVHEYFCFPEKFFYLDLCRFSPSLPSWTGQALTVRIWLDGEAPAWWNLSKENFQQFCTPAINLSREHAYPIDLNQRLTEYPICVDQSSQEAHQVHSVTSIVGRPTGQLMAEPRAYRSFLDFRHSQDEEAYYQVRTRSTESGVLEHTLSMVSPDGSPTMLLEQVLAVDVEAFNGDYPSRLRPGDVCFRGDDLSQLVGSVRNLSSPTSVRWPVTERDTSWRFISHLGLNHLSISSIDSLLGILRLYDWTGEPANAKRLAGLKSVNIRDQRAVTVRQGMVVQGIEVGLTLDESCFTDIGDAFLFGQVLRHFLALYATVNSFVRVRVECSKSKEEWLWPALDGRQMVV